MLAPACIREPVVRIGIPPSLAHGFVVHDDYLGAPESIEPLRPKLAPKARRLPAVKGQRIIGKRPA